MPGMPTIPGMGGITVIDTPSLPSGPSYTTVYTDLCTYYWHPGVFLKIDNPKNNIDVSSLGEGSVLTTNRVIRTTTPSGGSSGWLTNGTSGSINNSVYQYYKTKKSNQTIEQAVTHTTLVNDATGSIGNRQANYPSEEKIVINKYAATGCSVSDNAQRNKYKKSFAFNQPIKGNYFNQSKWVKFCHDYEMTTFTDLNVSYYDSQPEALVIRRVKNRVPTPVQTVLTVKTIPEEATVDFITPGSVTGKSILVRKNTVVEYTVSLDHYQTETRSTMVTESTTDTVVLNPEIIMCTLTITPGPETAIVSFNGASGTIIGNSIAVETGTEVHVTVSAPGYTTRDEYITVISNINVPIILEAEPIQPSDYTLTVVPSPSDSLVTFNTQGTISGNSITVPQGTIVDYTVYHDGYITQNLSTTVNSDITVNVVLQTSVQTNATLTINPTPNDATVSFDTGQIYGNQTTVPAGTTVTYTVSRSGYDSQSASIVVSSDLTLNVELQQILYTLTVNTEPATAVVTFNTPGSVSGNTIAVPINTDVSYTVSATGYITQNTHTVVDQTKSVTVTLIQAIYYTILINPTPSNANVEFLTPGTVTGHSITVEEGVTVSYRVSATGYVTQTDSTTADQNKTINVELVQSMVTLTIDPTPADAIVTFNTQGTVSGNSITVPQDTEVSYTVAKEDYVTFTDVEIANQTKTVGVILTYQPYEEGEVVFESAIPGSHTVNLLIDGRFQLIAVAGGGGAANGFKYGPQQQGYFNGSAGGGSGGYSSNISNIPAGQISVSIGYLGNTEIAENEGETVGSNGTNTTIGNYIIAYGGTAGYVDMTINPMTATAGIGGIGTTTTGLDGGSYKNTLRTVQYRQSPCNGGTSVYLTYGAGSGITYNTDHDNLESPGTNGYAKIIYLGSSNPENVTISINPTPNHAAVSFATDGTVIGNSITVLQGTVVTYTVSASGYYDKTQNVTATVNRTIDVELVARPPQYTLTIEPGPQTATVQFLTEGTVSGNSITVEAGTEVFYTVSETGYITESSSVIVNTNQTIQVVLQAEHIVTPDPILTISPTPATATVTFNTPGTVSGNTIAVTQGTTVEYTVSATGYTPVTDTYTVTQDVTVSVILQPIPVILTITTSPQNATVVFNTPGTVSGNSITVNQGTSVEYTVSANGYVTKTETHVAETTQTLLVTLQPIYVTLTIAPSPSDATVTFNSAGTVSGNSITVVQYSNIDYTVARTGYNTETNTVPVVSTQTINVNLVPINYTLTVNPTYSGASVTFNTSGTVSGNSITVPYGTNVSYTLTASGHETRTLDEMVYNSHTVTPQMRLSLINPTIASTAAVANAISDGGQAITAGHYQYIRGGTRTYDFDVNTDARGVVTSITNIVNTGGSVTGTNPHQLIPTGGWVWLEVWD